MNLIALLTSRKVATARNTLRPQDCLRITLSMARSAIGTRSVTGRAAAAAELAKSSMEIARVNGELPGAAGMGTGVLKDTIAEDGESELSSVPSDLSDEEGAVHNKITTSRHFVSSTVTGVLPITLGKRQRPTATDVGAGSGASGSVDRKLRKKVKPEINNGRELISYEGPSGTASSLASTRGVLSPIRKRPADSSIGILSPSRRATRKLPMTEPQVETFREEVEDLSIDTEDSGEIVEGKGKKPARGGGNKKRPKLSPPSPLPPPPHWEEMYSLVRSMRSRIPAPVDTMGCERLAQPIGGPVTPAVSRFQTLVSLLLSSQTKDTVTAVAVRKMQTLLPGGLTIPSILATDPQTLDGLITPVGFHNKKTQYLLQAAQICREKYNSDIPRSIEELCSLPGVGPKMAHLCMSAAWNETQGIGVDVHVHRITNMWKWTGKKGTETPEQTRLALESWLPKDKWREINHLLVGFGQTVCLSRAPRCGECSLADRGLCRAARVPPALGNVSVKREVKVEVKEEEDVGIKVEGECKWEREMKREAISLPTLVDVKWETEGSVQSRPRRVKREVKLEDRRTEVCIKREFKQEEVEEEVAVVKLEVKSEAIDDERVKREWKMEPEYAKEDIPDMEDILGGELQQLRSRRRRARA